MTRSLTVPLFAITLILSAFLLFSVQPYFARLILPLLGGSPSVWNTAMVFFQAMLLAGYAYAHATSHFFSIRAQAILHAVLLLSFAAFLPIVLPAELQPSSGTPPALWQLGIMAMLVGAPFFIIAASAPMFQRWFSASGHKDAANPYFLYAASNIGSMAALLSYPAIVEPLMTLKMQSLAWAGGYGVLIALTLLCAFAVWKNGARTIIARENAAPLTLKTKLIWIALAFIPSSLLLGVTTHVTTDIASVPLLWIVPLALYLATFIIVFARRSIFNMRDCAILYSTAFIFIASLITATVYDRLSIMFIMHFVLFFFAALMCHKMLADRRPDAAHLTSFYLYMSLGGVLGGMFNALLAPLLFKTPIEYTVLLCLTLFVRAYILHEKSTFPKIPPILDWVKSPSLWLAIATFIAMYVAGDQAILKYYFIAAGLAGLTLIAMRRQPIPFAVFGSFILLVNSPLTEHLSDHHILQERNFFGVLRVIDSEDQSLRNFLHGTTLHGAQPKQADQRLMQMTYYNPVGPLGDVFRILDREAPAPQKIGGIGLGVGTIACYTQTDRSFDFYEIDPAVARIAEDKNLFTYLSDCGSPYQIILGDGRLTLNNAQDGLYDLLIIDAFSSDNIPMHLITLEAFQGYMKKVKPNGMIIFNTSNRFIDLEPQLAALSAATKVPSLIKYSSSGPVSPDSTLRYTAAEYIVFTPDPDKLIRLRTLDNWTPTTLKPGFRIWTDDYANIIAGLNIFNP